MKRFFLIVVLSVLVNFFLAAYNLLLPFSNQIFPDIAIGLYGSFLTAEAFDGIIGALIIGISKKRSTNSEIDDFIRNFRNLIKCLPNCILITT